MKPRYTDRRRRNYEPVRKHTLESFKRRMREYREEAQAKPANVATLKRKTA